MSFYSSWCTDTLSLRPSDRGPYMETVTGNTDTHMQNSDRMD